MGAGHGHGHGHGEIEVPTRTSRLLFTVAAIVAAVTGVLVAINWPGQSDVILNLGGATTDAEVQFVIECEPIDADTCAIVRIEIQSGPDTGQLFELPPIYNDEAGFDAGDSILVDEVESPDAPFRYVYVDRDRAGVLWVLAAIFAVSVVLLGGLRGIRALLGLATSVTVLGLYTMPALVEGQEPLLVACLSAAIITFFALYLAHGFNAMTSVAVLGTLAALAMTVALGAVFIELAQFSGFATEEAFYIRAASENIDLGGLLLAGLVIGALGALDDMTVTQASVVFELRSANTKMSRRALFESAMRVGRDHVASTVNTLFLAYAGASLPLLLLFVVGDLPVLDVLNSEIVATELVRTIVGSVGLVASVPLTTALGVWAVTSGTVKATPEGRPPKERPEEGSQAQRAKGSAKDHSDPTQKSLRQRLRDTIDD